MAKVFQLRKKDSTPKNQVRGTSYTASPAVVPSSNVYKELGSQRGSTIQEIVPELANRAIAQRTYNKMTKGDVSVRISLRAGKTPVLGGDYYVEPYSENAQSVEIAEFIDRCVLHSPSAPWKQTLFHILHMLENGNSVLEPVYALREWAPKKTSPRANRKQYTMLNKLSYRPASTIQRFTYDDNGGPISAIHNAIRADGKVEEVELEIDKLLVFTFEGDGGTLEGESILRPAYEHWYYKHQLYKIDAIQKERHGIGVPDISLLPGFSEEDKRIAHELGRNLRTNEYAYIVRPPLIEVGFAELSGNLVDVLKSASHHDLQIMKNVLIQFLQPEVQGGRATSATAADVFLKSMRYLAEFVCEVVNRYLIPNLVAYNFDTDEYPELKVRNIGEVKDLQMWAAAMGTLVDKNILTMDDESEQYCREIVQWPRKLTKRPESTLGPSNVKQQFLLRDDPDTPENEDLVGQAAVDKAKADAAAGKGTGGGGTGRTTGNINKGTLSGV